MPPFNPANPATYSSQNPATINVPLAPGAQPTPIATANPNYTPITNTPTPPPTNNVVQTAGNATNQYNNLSGNLTNMLGQLNQPAPEQPKLSVNNYSDAYTQALDAQAQRGSAATKALIGSIQAANQNMRNSLTTQYDNYKRGLASLGIQTNSAQSSPQLLMGHIQQAQNEYVGKIQQLNIEEANAMREAESARADKDLTTLKEKMNYIKEIQKEKDDALAKTYEKMTLEGKIGDTQAAMFYDQLQNLNDKDKENFLIALSKKHGIPLQALIKGIDNEKERREGKAKKATGGGTGAGKSWTKTQLDKMEQAGIDPDDREAALDFLYGKKEKDPFESLKPSHAGQELKMTKKTGKKLEEAGIESSDIITIQKKLAEGYSLKQIASASGMPEEIYQIFSNYIK